MTIATSTFLPPRIGMLAVVRNRRGVITSVEPFDAGVEGRVHLTTVEYIDQDGPPEDVLLWEREPGARVLRPAAMPNVEYDSPMVHDEFDALVRATRWTAISPFVDPDGSEGPLTRLPLVAPFHGAIQVEDFQLVPLLKALQMPRVSLLLADDVGLGKTIEAGLILTELILRRRVRRILVLAPASLRTQWRQEMREKFSLTFERIDRESTDKLRRSLGLDANPWRTHSHAVASYDYLKQYDVLQDFLSASRVPENSPHLPWDLLIVDEAHNLQPGPFGDDSALTKMLAQIAPLFEHKLFLTATPHNGHTRSFSGLLELLDPVRFSRKSDRLTDVERARVEEVVVRRLKSEINARSTPPRFGKRDLAELKLDLRAGEQALSEAFEAFRKKVHAIVRAGARSEQLAGAFAVEVLGKRLLSCPATFADSWHRYQEGAQDVEADAHDVVVAECAVREDVDDDREAESRIVHATRTVGGWLRPLADRLRDETAAIGAALRDLGLARPGVSADPAEDSRFGALVAMADSALRSAGAWRADERLIVFTEYKTTLDYLKRRLRHRYAEHGVVRVLYGGMDGSDGEGTRDGVKAAFNDPADPVRMLVATDAASEGLNLQETARYLLHYDVPWNPARLEQRNGRLDRHGQARDVTVFHFTSENEADLRFLGRVVSKVHAIREELGATGEVFDAAFQQRFVRGESAEAVENDLDKALAGARTRADMPRDSRTGLKQETGHDDFARLQALKRELDLDAVTLRDTLEIGLAARVGRPRFEAPDPQGRVRLLLPLPPDWAPLVDDTLRLRAAGGGLGPLPALTFDSDFFVQSIGGRPVFRPVRDTALLHLGHPLFHRALASFARARFPGAGQTATRWTVRRTPIPAGLDALMLLTVEEVAVNELRESFHHWVRTLAIPVTGGILLDPLPHVPAMDQRAPAGAVAPRDVKTAREMWDEIELDLKERLEQHASALSDRLETTLSEERDAALDREHQRFQSRQGELSAMIAEQTLGRLEREIEELQKARKQGLLFEAEERLAELAATERQKQDELHLRTLHYERLREQLTAERERVITRLLPARYARRVRGRLRAAARDLAAREARHGRASVRGALLARGDAHAGAAAANPPDQRQAARAPADAAGGRRDVRRRPTRVPRVRRGAHVQRHDGGRDGVPDSATTGILRAQGGRDGLRRHVGDADGRRRRAVGTGVRGPFLRGERGRRCGCEGAVRAGPVGVAAHDAARAGRRATSALEGSSRSPGRHRRDRRQGRAVVPGADRPEHRSRPVEG